MASNPTLATTPNRPLPSQSSAAALVGGELGALPMLAIHVIGRAAIIGAGIALLTQERDGVRILKSSLAGSATIELFVLLHELLNRPKAPATQPPQ